MARCMAQKFGSNKNTRWLILLSIRRSHVHLMFGCIFLQEQKILRVCLRGHKQTTANFSHFDGVNKGYLPQQLGCLVWTWFGGASYPHATSLVAVLAAQLPDFVALKNLPTPCVMQQQCRFHHGSRKRCEAKSSFFRMWLLNGKDLSKMSISKPKQCALYRRDWGWIGAAAVVDSTGDRTGSNQEFISQSHLKATEWTILLVLTWRREDTTVPFKARLSFAVVVTNIL